MCAKLEPNGDRFSILAQALQLSDHTFIFFSHPPTPGVLL